MVHFLNLLLNFLAGHILNLKVKLAEMNLHLVVDICGTITSGICSIES